MSLHFMPTERGGRVAKGETMFGDYQVEWDETGRIQSATLKIRDPAERTDCRHRGDKWRLVECKTCKGRVQLKVFDCDVFGECTVGTKNNQIACCNSCDRYEGA